MEKTEALRQKVQSEIVRIITSRLEAGEMSEERAKEIAQLVLEKLPEGISHDKLMKIIPKLDDHFHELTEAVVPIMVEYEQKMHTVIDQKIKQLLQQGKLDEALKLTQKAIEFEKEFS